MVYVKKKKKKDKSRNTHPLEDLAVRMDLLQGQGRARGYVIEIRLEARVGDYEELDPLDEGRDDLDEAQQDRELVPGQGGLSHVDVGLARRARRRRAEIRGRLGDRRHRAALLLLPGAQGCLQSLESII